MTIPMTQLMLQHEDILAEIYDRIEKMKDKFERIIDEYEEEHNSYSYPIHSRMFSLPGSHESITNVFFNGHTIISEWEYIDAFDDYDTHTTWHTPTICFDMDEEELEKYVLEKYKEVVEEEHKRELHSLKCHAEMLGYGLTLNLEKTK